MTADALPAAYLHRLVLANTRLGDDYWLHGVMAHPAGLRLVVSQRDIVGEPAAPREIARHFVTAGFEQVNAKTFFAPAKNLLVSDAHTANVFRTPEGIAPFDVCVQQPQGALRRAVEPSPTLSFRRLGGGATRARVLNFCRRQMRQARLQASVILSAVEGSDRTGSVFGSRRHSYNREPQRGWYVAYTAFGLLLSRKCLRLRSTRDDARSAIDSPSHCAFTIYT